MNNNNSEVIAVSILVINTENVVSYRPPKTKLNYFNGILANVEEILKELEKPEPIVDFNFHFNQWQERGTKCGWVQI